MKTIISIILVIISTSVLSQNLSVYKVTNNSENPKLQWYSTGEDQEARKFTVWRSKIDGDKFENIQTLAYINNHLQDTLLYTVKDTTLIEKGIYRYYIQFQTEEAHGALSPMVYGHNMGYIPAPRVLSMKVESSKERKAIEISWELNNDFSVNSLTLFRSSHYNKDFVKIADLSGDASSYSDLVPLSNHNYFYFILISDFFGYQQPSVPTPGFCSFRQKTRPPQNLQLESDKSLTKLNWLNVEDNLSGYQVFRSIGKKSFRALHVMQTSKESYVQFTDTLPNNLSESSMVRYYVINYSDSYTQSNSTDTVSFYHKVIPTPMPPEDFEAILIEDHHIKLIWDKNQQEDIKGYNIYITQPNQIKLNKELIPAFKNYFSDTTTHGSGTVIYAIEKVNNKGMISEFRSIASVNILPPYYHLVVDMHPLSKATELTWKALSTSNIKKIYLYRQEDENEAILLKEFKNEDTNFTDHKLGKGKTYFYFFYGELSNGEKILLNDHLSNHL